MSKITEILERFRIEQEAKSRCTVAQLAQELNKDVRLLLEQFADAGVLFSGADDEVLEEHKRKLLDWLKGQHFPRSEKKITLSRSPKVSPFENAWKAVAANENGAEWDFIVQFSGDVILGHEIDPDQQRLANLIFARAVVLGTLPLKRVGRPSERRADELTHSVAREYWEKVDSGCSSAEAVNYLSSKFHKTERQIFRYVSANKSSIWRGKEGREQERELFRFMASSREQNPDSFAQQYALHLPDMSSVAPEDCLDHLDEVIAIEAKRFTDSNGRDFIDSDIDD